MRSFAAAMLALLSTPAFAQAYQCTPPARLGTWTAPYPDGPSRRAVIGRYTLAVSWAPEYCRSDRNPASIECSERNGRFGFVLHGLWPESVSGPPPQWCGSGPRPSAELIRRNLCMTPIPQMLDHEWTKHGTCMAKTPQTYFATEAGLWRTLRWPDADRLSRKAGLTVKDLREAISLANPAWKPEQIGVLLSDRGWLRELRLCYSRRFKPIACAPAQLGPPGATPLKIWRGL